MWIVWLVVILAIIGYMEEAARSRRRRERELNRIRALMELQRAEAKLKGLRQDMDGSLKRIGNILELTPEQQNRMEIDFEEWLHLTPAERYEKTCRTYPEYIEGRVEEQGGRKVLIKIQPDGNLGYWFLD